MAGGEAGAGAGYFVRPTVFADVRPDARIVREEIFGPVVVAQPFDTLDDAVRLANDSVFGLGASIWSNDLSRVQPPDPAHRGGHGLGQHAQYAGSEHAVRRFQAVGHRS